MKRAQWMLFPILILSLAWLGCENNDNVVNSIDHYAEEPFSFTVDLQDQIRFRLEGVCGTVEVTGRPGATSIIIAGERRVGSSSTADAEARLGDLQVEVQDLAHEVLVRTVQPEDAEGASYTVDYTITLPPDLKVKISNVTGTVAVDSVDNEVSVNSVIGNVCLDEIQGSAVVALVTGSIECKIVLPPSGVIDLSTVTGSIVLQIPQDASAYLSASVVTGTIGVSNLSLQDQNISNNSVSGKLGDGDGTISLRVITGSMNVTGY